MSHSDMNSQSFQYKSYRVKQKKTNN